MPLFAKPKTAAKVLLIKTELIDPSPWQARTEFDEQELQALADSIRQRGLLQPISVRKKEDRYELVAGERRLRAARLAGLTEIPALMVRCSDENSALLGLEENLRRADLNCFEQASGLKELVELWGCSQSEAAQRLGMSQPALANKLRLLQITPEQQQRLLAAGLTERHARALLRLPPAARDAALEHIVKAGLNVGQTEAYIQTLVSPKQAPKRLVLIRDVRIFVNTINRAVKTMVSSGVPATANRTEGEGYIEYTVRIPTAAASREP